MLIFVRAIFICLAASFGYGVAVGMSLPIPWPWITLGIGAGIAFIFVMVDRWLTEIPLRGVTCAMLGAALGVAAAFAIGKTAVFIHWTGPWYQVFFSGFTIALAYWGAVVVLRGQDQFNVVLPFIEFSRTNSREELIVLDTSVIIDGRIADICQTDFLQGRLIIPRFVLKELQAVADSSDPLKRNRGRRGLDVLGKIQKSTTMDVKIHEADFPDIPEVDAKLVKLAQGLNAKIFTNDFNLNKVARLQGVKVLNMNDLANALKPVVLPGEVMEVRIIRDGKEPGQGVGYLDDGTMIVVDNARQLIGQKRRVLVTSILQTQAGRMVFSRLENSSRPDRPGVVQAAPSSQSSEE